MDITNITDITSLTSIIASSSLISIERNTDEVEIGGWLDVLSTGTNLSSGGVDRTFINTNNLSKIRSYGYVEKIKFYPNLSSITTEYWFQVWRKIAGVYTIIYEENILSKITQTTINTITLAQSVLVQEGDILGFATITTGSSSNLWKMTSSLATSIYYASVAKQTTGYDWESQSQFSYTVPLKALGQAPLMVAIGDSIMAGAPTHTTFVVDSKEDDHEVSIAHNLYELDNKYIYQNNAVGSKDSAWVAAAMADYVIAFKPSMALINGGVNDIAAGTVNQATFIANWTSILDDCAANSIIPIVCKIASWTAGTNTEMRTRDLWNAALATLVSNYAGAICIDFDSVLGEFRTGGDTGNLWDIQSAYDSGDHVHMTALGYEVMAGLINTEIKKKYVLQ